MLESVLRFFGERDLGQLGRDALDIFIVAYVVYRALLVVKGTRAMQMGFGLGIVFLVYLTAKFLRLDTLLNLLSGLLSSIVLVVVVVFQNDIRRALIRVGSRAWLSGGREQQSRVIDEVVGAATELARHRIGAIIAFEQDANILEFARSEGVVIESAVSRELLVAMFYPESLNKLHDGAVVIRNLKVARAGVFFPMPETKILDASLGSRHRAALGITEETDAVVVVVSEERGTISFGYSGNIVSNLDGPSLRHALLGLFGRSPRKRGIGGRMADLAKNVRAGGSKSVDARPISTRPPGAASTPIPPSVRTPLPAASRTPTPPIAKAAVVPSASVPMRGASSASDPPPRRESVFPPSGSNRESDAASTGGKSPDPGTGSEGRKGSGAHKAVKGSGAHKAVKGSGAHKAVKTPSSSSKKAGKEESREGDEAEKSDVTPSNEDTDAAKTFVPTATPSHTETDAAGSEKGEEK